MSDKVKEPSLTPSDKTSQKQNLRYFIRFYVLRELTLPQASVITRLFLLGTLDLAAEPIVCLAFNVRRERISP